MPRAFLIKKHNLGKENAGKVKPLPVIETTDLSKRLREVMALEDSEDLSRSESKGPFDLSVKTKNLKIELAQEEERNESPIKRSPPSVIEFSPKIVTPDYKGVYKMSFAIPSINRETPLPSHFSKPVATLDALNFHSVQDARIQWSNFYPVPYRYPYLHIPRPAATEFFNNPVPYLGGTALVSPPVLPMSTPQIELQQRIPSQFFCNNTHPELNSNDPGYLQSWGPKEGSTSPVSENGEFSPESASNKYNSVVSSSTGSPISSCSQPARYQCMDCHKSYATYSGLSRHRQFHCITQAKKAFNCKHCEKVYVSLGALKMHIRTHTLPCKCTICGKAFSRPWLLQGHIRTHTGEKPFSCQHCSRAFADRSNLRAHLQTHSDIKKYSCNVCSKTFSRMSLLLKHNDGGCVPGCPNVRFAPVAIQNC